MALQHASQQANAINKCPTYPAVWGPSCATFCDQIDRTLKTPSLMNAFQAFAPWTWSSVQIPTALQHASQQANAINKCPTYPAVWGPSCATFCDQIDRTLKTPSLMNAFQAFAPWTWSSVQIPRRCSTRRSRQMPSISAPLIQLFGDLRVRTFCDQIDRTLKTPSLMNAFQAFDPWTWSSVQIPWRCSTRRSRQMPSISAPTYPAVWGPSCATFCDQIDRTLKTPSLMNAFQAFAPWTWSSVQIPRRCSTRLQQANAINKCPTYPAVWGPSCATFCDQIDRTLKTPSLMNAFQAFESVDLVFSPNSMALQHASQQANAINKCPTYPAVWGPSCATFCDQIDCTLKTPSLMNAFQAFAPWTWSSVQIPRRCSTRRSRQMPSISAPLIQLFGDLRVRHFVTRSTAHLKTPSLMNAFQALDPWTWSSVQIPRRCSTRRSRQMPSISAPLIQLFGDLRVRR